jgi:hypothetical protein
MKRVKTRTFSGVICEQEVYLVSDKAAEAGKLGQPRVRFKSEEERRAHREAMARRKCVQLVNANFAPGDLYATLTFDDAHEVHTFEEARRVRNNYIRRLQYAYPEAVIFCVMGRGETTSRIHFHLIVRGIPKEAIAAAWKCGGVKRVVALRDRCVYDGVDHGADYTGLANYLFDHWTEEQGGHHYYMTRNARRPEREEPVVCNRVYTEDKPPVMRGYTLVEVRSNRYGYIYYKFVKEPKKAPRGRPRKVE